MARTIRAGATSQTIYLEILDSTSTTGGRKTGLVYDTAGLVASYVLVGGSRAAITLATLAAANSAWSSGGFKEVDATNMPGIYRLDVPDAALASGPGVVITLTGATGMVPTSVEIQLVAWNPQDTVRGGLTALPNAAAEASGGLYTRGSGAGQIAQSNNGQIDVDAKRLGGTTNTGRDIGASVLLSSGTGTGQLDFTSGVVKANLAQILGTALTETAGQIAAAFKQFFDVASPTGTMKAITNVVTVTNLTNAATSGDLTATMKASVNTEADTALSDYGALKPTTAGRTLDVTATGEAGIDWGNIGGPTSTVNLSGTTVKTLTDAPSDSSGVTTLLSRLSATRAGYLDNLSAGAVATAAKLLSYFQSALRKDVTVDADIGGNYDDATDSQEAIRDRGDSAWTTATGFATHTAADVWAVATRLLTAGTNIVLAKGTGITGFNDLSAAQVNAEVDTALGDYDAPTKTELDSAVAPLALETTAQDILTDTATSLPSTLSTIAGYLDTEIAAILTAVDTEVAAILADTNELQTDWVDGGRLDALIDAIKAKTDQLTFTVSNQVDANALTLDEDEILDDLLADSVPADGSLPTVRQAIYMILQFLLERSVSGTTLTVKKVDGSTSLMTFTLNDATSPTSITRAT